MLQLGSIEWIRDFNENVDKYVIRNKNHEMYLQRLTKLALNAFDDKPKHLNKIESEPWS